MQPPSTKDVVGREDRKQWRVVGSLPPDSPLEAGPTPTVAAGLLVTHPDRCLQLCYKLVIDSLCHLRLQLVEALITVSESLVTGGKARRQRSSVIGFFLGTPFVF